MSINEITGRGGINGCSGLGAEEPRGTSSQAEAGDDALMPQPLQTMLDSGDPMEKLAALIAHSFQKDRHNARKSAALEERNIAEEGRKRVEAMRDQADAIRKEAYTTGAVKVVSGAATIESNLQLAVPNNVQIDEELYSALISGGDKVVGGIGDVIAGSYKGAQIDLEADAAEHEALSDAAKRRAEDHRDQAREARELLDKVSGFLREVKGAQDGASKAAILRA